MDLAVGAAAEVKSKLSVVDVVGQTVQLKKSGSTFKGLCPFHGEKTASFYVTPARESWKCFGCGLGGDIFSFIMQRDSVSFPEALKVLAARAGVELDERTSREDARRKRLTDVLEAAVAFYHTVLTGHPSGLRALEYLRGRGFTDETIQAYQIGWAPEGWETMSRQLQAKRNVTPQELADAGLTRARGTGRGGAYDFFRERIMFPIRDMNGKAIGFGGRALVAEGDTRDHGGKYLNSQGSPLFDKSRTLYLIDKAKASIRKSGQAVIVEGYTDALMAHQAGFDNVVATLGTALTPGHVALLTRYAKKVALAYDVDPAGQSAGTFGVTELNNLISEVQVDGGVGLTDVGVVRLPEGKDPDEVIRESPDTWREAVRTPDPILAYLIDHHASRVDVRTPEGRKRLVDAVLPTLRKVGDPTIRDTYLQLLARRSTVSEQTLLEALHRRPDVGRSVGAPGGGGAAIGGDHTGARITLDAVRAAAESVSPEDVVKSITPVEVDLLRLILLIPEMQARLEDDLRPEELPSTVARELYAAILADRRRGAEAAGDPDGAGRFERGRFLEALDPETRALALGLYALERPDPRNLPASRVIYNIEKCLLTLEADRLEERSDWNQAEQADAELREDQEAMARILAEERQINEARRSLDRRIEQTRLLTRPASAVAAPAPAGGVGPA
ncbi:MAG: DNA primase [Chloroflexota bacterium]